MESETLFWTKTSRFPNSLQTGKFWNWFGNFEILEKLVGVPIRFLVNWEIWGPNGWKRLKFGDPRKWDLVRNLTEICLKLVWKRLEMVQNCLERLKNTSITIQGTSEQQISYLFRHRFTFLLKFKFWGKKSYFRHTKVLGILGIRNLFP